MLLIVGLGNPGEEYDNTRHNAGRIVLSAIAKRLKWPEWKHDMKANAQIVTGEIEGKKLKFMLPDTFMNNSGNAVATIIKTQKDASGLVVVYDDLDLPIGTLKISFDRGDGGHNGIISITKRVKTQKFWRIRLGIAPVTPSGKIKRLPEAKKGVPHLMGEFKESELAELKKLSKKVEQILEMFATRGGAQAMNEFN